MTASQKLLWVCELNKEKPSKVWKATDLMELEDEEDSDFVINSLVLKTAVLGSKAVENERNIIAIKTKSNQDKEIEQPIFSLTLGRNDMVSGMDLTLANDSAEIEFKLIEGSGPVFITCNHVVEMPTAEEQQTIMTASDGDLEESVEDEEEEEEEMEDEKDEEKPKNGKAKNGGLKNGNAKNGKIANGKNGDHVNGTNGKEIECDEKPNKRRRN